MSIGKTRVVCFQKIIKSFVKFCVFVASFKIHNYNFTSVERKIILKLLKNMLKKKL